MSENPAPRTGPGTRTARRVLTGVVTMAVFAASGAMAATLADRQDAGALATRHAPRLALAPAASTTVVVSAVPTTVVEPAVTTVVEPAVTTTVEPAVTTTVEPVVIQAVAPAAPPVSIPEPVQPVLPPSAPPVPAAASAVVVVPPPAPVRCTITYSLDGVSADIAGRAFGAVSAQAPIDFVPASGTATVHIRSYWPSDNPTNAFGWTGDVHGQLSIYLKPILQQTPDFAGRMLVHELGHVLGLDHTTSGSPMDNMPQTDQFTPAQQQAMRLPC